MTPASVLDAEPVLYKGLGMTAIVQTVIASLAAWTLPGIVIAGIIADGVAVLMTFLVTVIIGTFLTVIVAAHAVRRIQRGRPYNWLNRRIAALVSAYHPFVVTGGRWWL